ncbi:MAG TPA: hypothetical protein VGA61_10570, partial [Anaerolineae bacterium]
MNALRRRLWRLGLIALVLGLSLSGGSPAAAFGYPQDSGFKVVILRPGPGETYYAGPDSPRTAVYVLGRVSGGEFAPEQIEILLTILEDGRPSGEAHASATAGGDFNFLIATNPDGPEEVGRSSGNCYPCHGPVSLAFPGRRSLLRVTATDPLGRSAVAERWITIERPRLAEVTVRARLAGGSELAPPGLPISATTNLLGWRGRQFSS